MKQPAAPTNHSIPKPANQFPREASKGKIHPVIVYPFKPPADYTNLEELYRLVARLDGDPNRFARPITIIDPKTISAIEKRKHFQDFRNNIVARYSDILEAWCVDTCQMWYSGLSLAFSRGGPEDVYWLIPGDFNYGTPVGQTVLSQLHDLPEIVLELNQDLCIGEIATDHNNSKQIIDTYGTFALLYNWFPTEAQKIRTLTERPRSEFFAIRHRFLSEIMNQRWFAYEQTMVMLLKAVVGNKQTSRFFVGNISDLPEEGESLASAIQQVERTERVLKTIWREQNQSKAGWIEPYRHLEVQSEQIRRTAEIILHSMLH